MMQRFALTVTMILMSTAQQPVSALNIDNTPGWVTSYEVPPSSQGEKYTLGRLERVLIPATDESGLNPGIQVISMARGQSDLGADKEAWRQAVFKHHDSRRIIFPETERAFQRDGHWTYMVDSQTEKGPDATIKSTLLATDLNGKVIVLIFENHREVYNRYIQSVRRLFSAIRISN